MATSEIPRGKGQAWIENDHRILIEQIMPGVIHEVNNLNQTILLSSQILGDIWKDLKSITEYYYQERGAFTAGGMPYSTLRDELEGYIVAAVESSDRIHRLMGEVRKWVRRFSETSEETLDLNRAIEPTVLLLAHFLRSATDRLMLDLSPVLPEIAGWQPAIQQSLLRLLRFCGDSLNSHTQGILVTTKENPSGSGVIMVVSHEGPGLPSDQLDELKNQLSGTAEQDVAGDAELAAALKILQEQGARIDLGGIDEDTFVLSAEFRGFSGG